MSAIRNRVKQWEDWELDKVTVRYPQFTFLETGFLWEAFSTENFCAGFLTVTDDYIQEFDRWLTEEFWEWFIKEKVVLQPERR